MNHEDGPDVIGVCEVENRRVLTMLRDRIDISGRQYRIAHHETSDKRGIDVAFIYDSSIVTAGDQFFILSQDLFCFLESDLGQKEDNKCWVWVENYEKRFEVSKKD